MRISRGILIIPKLNDIGGNEQTGVMLADASKNTIGENTVVDTTTGRNDLIGENHYTPLDRSHHNVVRENKITSTETLRGAGIRILHANENTLTGNNGEETADHGISFFEVSGAERVEKVGDRILLKSMSRDYS